MAALPALRRPAMRPRRVRQLRDAALADEHGKQLAAMMSAVPA